MLGPPIYMGQRQNLPHSTTGEEQLSIPFRSRYDKPSTGGLVVKWVTISEYPLLNVFVCPFLLLIQAPLYFVTSHSFASLTASSLGSQQRPSDRAPVRTRRTLLRHYCHDPMPIVLLSLRPKHQ